jgi:hypothetical protein
MTYEQVHNPDDGQDAEDHERYLCTEKELETAGFTVGDLSDMPETDPEFIPDPKDRLVAPVARHGAAGALVERFPAGRFSALLELVEIFGLDTPAPRRRVCSVL